MTGHKAYLRQVEPKSGKTVEFTYNPERITISHTLVMKELNSQSGSNLNVEEVVRRLGIRTIRIDAVPLFGARTKQECDQLLSWSEAVIKTPREPDGSAETVPIGLELVWGTGLHYSVHMETVIVTYLKFAGTTGTPVRALVNMTLHQYIPTKPGPNPTSGGLPDRRARVLDSSDRLPSLATAAYGRPSAWRDIARVNNIDDPLRVRPGRTVYLPNPDELAPARGERP